MAKPMAISFVLLAAIFDVFLLGQLRWKRLVLLAWLTLPLIALSIYTQQAVGNVKDPMALPFIGRVLNAVSALGLYFKQTVWAERLMTPYLPRWPLLPEFFLPSLILLGVIGGVVAYYLAGLFLQHKKAGTWSQRLMIPCQDTLGGQFRAWLVFGIVSFLVSVMPTLGIVSFGYQARADRFTYLPSVWLSVAVAGVLSLLFQRCRRLFLRLLVIGLCVGWLGVLATMSYRQTKFWRNTETLSRRVLAFEPDNIVANKNLGIYLFLKRTQLKEACAHMKRATELFPDPLLYISGTTMMIDSGEMEEAKETAARFVEAVKQKEAKGWNVHYRIAYAYYAFCTGDKDLAREHFDAIAEKNPTFAPVQYMLGRLALERGDKEAAKKAWAIAARDPLFSGWLK